MKLQRWFVLALCMYTCLLGCSDSKPVSATSTSPPSLQLSSSPSAPPLELMTGNGQLGHADFGEQRSCQFEIRNNSSQPIQLALLDKSCTCAGVELPKAILEPGKTGVVILHWSPKLEALDEMSVRLWAEVGHANNKLRLEATGIIEPRLKVAFPRGPLDFGKITLLDIEKQRTRRVVELYAHEHFAQPVIQLNMPGLVVESIEPLSAERMHTLKAHTGYRLTVQPTKDLPHGAFRGTLTIQTGLKKTALELPITGQFDTSLITISQDRWQLPPRLGLRSGYQLPAMTIEVRHGTCQQMAIERITPQLFDAKLTKVNDKTWRIELGLSRDMEAAQKRFTPEAWQHLIRYSFEQGSVILKLDHPDVKQMIIPISGTELVDDR